MLWLGCAENGLYVAAAGCGGCWCCCGCCIIKKLLLTFGALKVVGVDMLAAGRWSILKGLFAGCSDKDGWGWMPVGCGVKNAEEFAASIVARNGLYCACPVAWTDTVVAGANGDGWTIVVCSLSKLEKKSINSCGFSFAEVSAADTAGCNPERNMLKRVDTILISIFENLLVVFCVAVGTGAGLGAAAVALELWIGCCWTLGWSAASFKYSSKAVAKDSGA